MSEDPYNNPYNKVVNTVRGALWNGPSSRAADEVRERYIVIDLADLPTQDTILHGKFGFTRAEVHPRAERIKSGGAQMVVRGASPEYAESMARHYLALAQWLREHPPIDEAQVKAVHIVLGDISVDGARRLVEKRHELVRALGYGGGLV